MGLHAAYRYYLHTRYHRNSCPNPTPNLSNNTENHEEGGEEVEEDDSSKPFKKRRIAQNHLKQMGAIHNDAAGIPPIAYSDMDNNIPA